MCVCLRKRETEVRKREKASGIATNRGGADEGITYPGYSPAVDLGFVYLLNTSNTNSKVMLHPCFRIYNSQTVSYLIETCSKYFIFKKIYVFKKNYFIFLKRLQRFPRENFELV